MIKNKIICITALLFFNVIAFCQDLKHTNDTIVDKKEVININTTNYRGTLRWEQSYNGHQWFEINTENDTYSFTADTIKLVRARIDEFNCTYPWYSDTLLVNFSPKISYIEPNTGVIGDSIELLGLNFSVYKQTIHFNDIEGEIIFVNDSIIKTYIPYEIDTPNINIKISLYNTHDNYSLSLLAPKIANIYPDSASLGDTIVLKGENFSGNYDYNYVTTGIDNTAKIVFSKRDSLSFILPTGKYSSRNSIVKLCVGGQCDSIESGIFIDDPWLQKSDAPAGTYGRQLATGFQIGEIGYMGLGVGVGIAASSDFWKYNYKNDSWFRLNDFPGGARLNSFSFVINDTAYVGAGSGINGDDKNDLWKYNHVLDQWEQVSNIPVAYDDLSECAFSIEDKGYIITEEADSNFWAYSPASDKWELMPDFIPNDTYSGHADIACVINNKAYVLTNNNSTGVDEVWEFDPNTNTWTRKADQIADNLFYDGRRIFVIKNEAYLFPDSYHNVFSKYNPETDTWTILPQASPSGRNDGVIFVFDNKAYFGTGHNYSTSLKDFWEYDPSLEDN